MAKPYISFKKEEKEKLRSSIDAKLTSLGIDSWEGEMGNYPVLKDYGLCSSCVHFQFASSEFIVKACKCSEFSIRLHNEDPIVECTKYYRIGQLSLDDMLNMATIIEVKEKVGFIK